MDQTEHFLQMLAEQIKDFDTREEARKAASEETDIQFLLSYAATNEPELLDRFELWDLLAGKEAWKDRFKVTKSLSQDGSLRMTLETKE